MMPRRLQRVYWAAALGGSLLVSLLGAAAKQAQAELLDPEALAQAGGIEIILPIRLDGRAFPAVPVQVTATEILAINPSRLAAVLAGALAPQVLAALRELGDQLVPIAQIQDLGIVLELQPQALEVLAIAPPELLQPEPVDLLGRSDPRLANAELVEVAEVAVGLDADLTAVQRLDDRQTAVGDDFRLGLGLRGFVNVGGLDGFYLDHSLTFNLRPGGGDRLLTSGNVVVFRDDRPRAIRFSALDIRLDPPALAGSPTLLGVAAERRFSEIQPDRVVRALGGQVLDLERQSTVEILVNGVLVRRFVAGPGPVDLATIPFFEAGSEVEVFVEDELGRRQVTRLGFAANEDLLDEGVSEFGLAAGFLQGGDQTAFDYDFTNFGALGYYRLGVTPSLTLGAHAAAGREFLGAGVSLVADLPPGLLQLDGAVSTVAGDTGYAANASYRADLTGPFGRNDQLDLRLGYVDQRFRVLGESIDTDQLGTGRFEVAAAYRLSVSDRTSLSFGAGYTRLLGDFDEITRLSLSISQQLGNNISASILAEQRFSSRQGETTNVFVSLSMPLGERLRGQLAYRSGQGQGTAEVVRTSRDRPGEYGYRLRLQGGERDTRFFGGADYVGNRGTVSGSLDQVLASAGTGGGATVGGATVGGATVGTLRLTTGLGFADGQFGLGRRAADGFFMLVPHPSLQAATVQSVDRSSQRAIATSGPLGPAVNPLAGSYRLAEISVGVEGAPVGYDLGPGEYAVRTGARSGVVVTIGSDAFRTAFGTLVDGDGQPVALRSGLAQPEDEGLAAVEFFTNRVGRFVLNGLSPGVYELVIDGFRTMIGVPVEAEALVELGTLEVR